MNNDDLGAPVISNPALETYDMKINSRGEKPHANNQGTLR